MPLHSHKIFFSQRKMLLMILCLIIVFFFSYVCVFLLGTGEPFSELQDIRYSFTSRETAILSSIHWKTADTVDEIKKEPGDNYLYIKAVLPELKHNQIYLRSFNGTAKISVADKEIFNNANGNRLSGGAYITVPLENNMSGETIEILLYSPLSDDFDILITPDTETVYSLSNLPYAFIYIASVILCVLVISLLLCFITPKHKAPVSAYLIAFSLLIALAVFTFEYSPLFGNAHFLFNLKLFMYLLIPVLSIIEIALRFNGWNSQLEAVLSINILYALCILCLGNNVFFSIMLYSGVFLQSVNFLLVINTMSRQGKPSKDMYCATTIVFWCMNVLLWVFIALQRVFWQPISFLMAVALYCFCSALGAYIENKVDSVKTEEVFASFFKKKRAEIITTAKTDAQLPNDISTIAQTADLHEPIIVHTNDNSRIPDNSLLAIAGFNNMIMKKVYGKDRHSIHVSEYSRIISCAMGMSKSASNEISKAAALHDIGKICIPEHVLFKVGKLTEEEFNEIKNHNIYGYLLLNSDEDAFFQLAARVAKEHHEHMDGSGYIGLKGSEISMPARIVAVADVFDALVSQRSYKRPWSFDDAVDYIFEHSSDYFDKDAVEAFVRAKEQIFEIYSMDGVHNPEAYNGEEE